MAQTVSFGVIGFTGSQSKPVNQALNSTITYSPAVSRQSFGSLRPITADPVLIHTDTRRRSSSM